MKLNRRDLLTQAGLFAAGAKLAPAATRPKNVTGVLTRADFPIAETQTYLNSAGWHPMSAASARGQSLRRFQEYRQNRRQRR